MMDFCVSFCDEGSSWLWSEIRHLQSGNSGMWAGQWQSAVPGHAAHSGTAVLYVFHLLPSTENVTMINEHSLPVSSSDAASEVAGFSLLSPRRPPLPARRHGGAQGVSLWCGFGDRRECCDWKSDSYCHCRETSKPRPQKPLCYTAQPGPTVPAAAAWTQVETERPFTNTLHSQSSKKLNNSIAKFNANFNVKCFLCSSGIGSLEQIKISFTFLSFLNPMQYVCVV